MPEIPSSLCIMVAKALALPKKNDASKKMPPDDWIGKYLRLENARDAKSFYAEVERLLSRSTFSKDAEMFDSLAFPMEYKNTTIMEQINSLQSTQTFRAWRSAFLLKVLESMARQRKFENNTDFDTEDTNEEVDSSLEETEE